MKLITSPTLKQKQWIITAFMSGRSVMDTSIAFDARFKTFTKVTVCEKVIRDYINGKFKLEKSK